MDYIYPIYDFVSENIFIFIGVLFVAGFFYYMHKGVDHRMMYESDEATDLERPLYTVLSNTLSDDYAILQNLSVKASSKIFKIDILIISKFGVFVISVKKYNGLIRGKRKADRWRHHTYTKLHADYFKNPIHENVVLMRGLEDATNIEYKKQHSIIVFPDSARWKKRVDPITMFAEEVCSYITKKERVLYTDSEIEAIYDKLKELNEQGKISYSSL